MSSKQIKIWYLFFSGFLFSLGLPFLGVSFFAETLGIDSGGSWGMSRILVAGLGFALIIFAILLQFPQIKVIGQTRQVAQSIRYLFESVLWILMVLVVCEITLRVTITQKPVNVYEEDWEFVPSVGSIRIWGKEGFGVTNYLHHGEIATPSDLDAGAISVVILGDSHTEAFQVMDDQKFVAYAENILRAEKDNFDLHNLGKSGYGVSDYIYLAPIIRQYYNPEIIVIQLSSGDFVGPDGGDSYNQKIHNSYFELTDVGKLNLVHNFQYLETGIFSKVTSKFMIYLIAQERYFQIMEKINAQWSFNDQFQPVHAIGTTILPVARMDEQLKLLKEAYEGTKVILLLLPFSPSINADGFEKVDIEGERILDSIENIGGFYILNPQSEFNLMVETGHLPRGFKNSLPGVGHLNVFGHKVIGELLAEKILEIAP